MGVPASLSLFNESLIEDLEFTVLVDTDVCYSEKIKHGKTLVRFDVPNDAGAHVLKFVLSGKQNKHTVINEHNTIVDDVLIKITDVEIDGINIDQILFNQAEYYHNFNGNGCETVESYIGVLGCNGDVKLPFVSPVYIWILENI